MSLIDAGPADNIIWTLIAGGVLSIAVLFYYWYYKRWVQKWG